MKRHLNYPTIFDSRALLLDEINPEWEEHVKELHKQNQAGLIQELKQELGENNFESKLKNFKDLGPAPFSILAHHVDFFNQCRSSFIQGFYYPALVSACSLGERIFNHMLLDLRDHFKHKSTYRKVYNKGSFCDWEMAIDTLVDWSVFQHDEVELEYRKLAVIRHRSIHFNLTTYSTLRQDSLEAIKIVSRIISLQFGYATMGHKWVIEGTSGHSFIKKEAENDPFIRKYYLPQSPLVGYNFAMQLDSKGSWLFFDYKNYDGHEISDEEFAILFNERDNKNVVPTHIPWDDSIVVQQIIMK